MPQTTPLRRRSRRATRAALALFAGVLVVAGLAAPANAERYIHRDPSRDVQKVEFMNVDDNGFVHAPRRKQGDVVKVKIWHQVRAVRVVGKYRQLDREGAIGQFVSIRTPDGRVHDFQVTAGPGAWKGVEDDSECIIGHGVNYKRDRFSMRISRSCLGRPRWVRVGVGVISFTDRAIFADDAQSRRVRQNLTYSPRLKHA